MVSLRKEEVKEFAKKAGADLVGIASIERFKRAPKELHPLSQISTAKAVISLGFRIPKGALAAFDQGDIWPYNAFGYGGLNEVAAVVVYNIT